MHIIGESSEEPPNLYKAGWVIKRSLGSHVQKAGSNHTIIGGKEEPRVIKSIKLDAGRPWVKLKVQVRE